METEILKARIEDTAEISRRTNKPKFLGFLSREEAIFTEKILSKTDVDFAFDGGYSDAERVFLGCFPDYTQEYVFPIMAVTFVYRKTDVLHHRDFLGSLMGLGLKREAVGDILIEEGRAVAFVSDEVAGYITSQLEKVGRTGVKITLGCDSLLPQKDSMTEHSVTVASERLDCVVSALAGVSRSVAGQLISQGLVSINSVVCEKATKTVSDADAVTIRGKGKFIIDGIDGRTRKNRIILKFKKYS